LLPHIIAVLNGGESMNEAPKLQDYMLPILKIFADGEEHLYGEIPAYLETRYALLKADRPNRARVMINNTIWLLRKGTPPR